MDLSRRELLTASALAMVSPKAALAAAALELVQEHVDPLDTVERLPPKFTSTQRVALA